MSAHLGSASRLPAARPAPARAARPAGWFGFVRKVLRAVETRRHLAGLDDHMLRDIGMTRMDVAAELRRAPWDIAPQDDINRRG